MEGITGRLLSAGDPHGKDMLTGHSWIHTTTLHNNNITSLSILFTLQLAQSAGCAGLDGKIVSSAGILIA